VFQLGSSEPFEISQLLDVSVLAAMMNTIVSIIALVATFATVESLRYVRNGLQFSLASLLIVMFVLAGICGFVVFDRTFDTAYPQHYIPLTLFPIYVRLSLVAGTACVLNAAARVACWIGCWALSFRSRKAVF
jgi:energy-converting hydrogenase Eha subunit C